MKTRALIFPLMVLAILASCERNVQVSDPPQVIRAGEATETRAELLHRLNWLDIDEKTLPREARDIRPLASGLALPTSMLAKVEVRPGDDTGAPRDALVDHLESYEATMRESFEVGGEAGHRMRVAWLTAYGEHVARLERAIGIDVALGR